MAGPSKQKLPKNDTELAAYIVRKVPDNAVVSVKEEIDGLVIETTPETLVSLVCFLEHDHGCLFSQLSDLCAVDNPSEPKRFTVVYQLLSMKHNRRLRVKVRVQEDEFVPSLHRVFGNAVWNEREVFDMYGVHFEDNPDMRRILTDYGFEGHPQRKDFPLTGYKQVRYDYEQKRVVYEPVKLDQDYRDFDFESPWEGADYILPGDEKAEAAK